MIFWYAFSLRPGRYSAIIGINPPVFVGYTDYTEVLVMKSGLMKKLFLLAMLAALLCVSLSASAMQDGKPVIGISWSYDEQEAEYAEYIAVIEAAGGVAVELPQITSTVVTYDANGDIVADCLEASGMLKADLAEGIKALDFAATNLADAMDGIDGVFFTGGEDISPSLYAVSMTEDNEGEAINATRDVSDYLLMGYCIENDVPTFAVCRGEQMMGIVSGCTFTQDIPNYYAAKGAAYADTHRMPADAENRDYARHDIEIIDKDSKLYAIAGADTLANVSSWHHQCIESIEGTNLTVTARTIADGVEIIEGIERKDKTFCVGVQFHPENDCILTIVYDTPDKSLCDYDTCLGFFKALVDAAAAKAM